MPSAPPPDRQQRNKCWAARDAYFACLDQHGLWLNGLKPESYDQVLNIDPANPPIVPSHASPASSWFSSKSSTSESPDKSHLFTCKQALKLFEQDCLPSWVTHFSLLRVKDLQKQALQDNLEQRDYWKK